MNITIGEYTIVGDGVCVSLNKRGTVQSGKNEGKETEKVIGHFPDLDGALQRVLSEELTAGENRAVKDILAAIRVAREKITEEVRRIYLKGMYSEN